MRYRYILAGTSLTLNHARCSGCLRCIEVCPHGVFEVDTDTVIVRHREFCMECGACALNCPSGAIQVDKGVGCAAAVINGLLGKPETCGCGGEDESCCPEAGTKSCC